MTLEVKNLSLIKSGVDILKSIDFTLENRTNLSLMGPSGSGKSSLARCILGLEKKPNLSGNIIFSGQDLACPDARAGVFGYVPQNLALWPHLNVEDTLLFTTRFTKEKSKSPSINYHWHNELIHLFSLESLKKRLPHELSGGEKQRLALARALCIKPKLIIFDEPFCALDVTAKMDLINLVKRMQSIFCFSAIFITHDLGEALAVGDFIMIINGGEKLWLKEKHHIRQANFCDTFNPLKSPLISPLSLIEGTADLKLTALI